MLNRKNKGENVLSVTFVSHTCRPALHGVFPLRKPLFTGTLWMILWFLAHNIAPLFIAFPSYLRHLSIAFASQVLQMRRNDSLKHGF